MAANKYQFWRALRPFSFSVALVVCLTGVLAAYSDGYHSPFIAGLIIIAGLLLQAGVNLINDYSDLQDLASQIDTSTATQIRKNFRVGLLCFLLSTVLGLYLIYISGWVLLLFCLVGFVGALGYTLEPINYKRRGLAVVAVFWLMGVLMVAGAYYILSSELNLQIFLISIPVSLYTSLLLLSNELRDYESDQQLHINTLTVRIGYERAVRLYYAVLISIFGSALGISVLGLIDKAWIVLLSLPVALAPLKYLNKSAESRLPLTPLTGKSFLIFGGLYCVAFLI